MKRIRSPFIAMAAIALLASPLVLLATLRMWPEHDPLLRAPTFHFWAVSGTALAAAVASGVIIASARTLRETRLLFLALAFVSIAGVFAVHGLMTPGFIAHEFYASVPISAWGSVFAGAAFVAVSAMEMPARLERFIARSGRTLVIVTVAAALGYGLLSVQVEHWLDWLPSDELWAQYTLTFSAAALLAFGAWRYLQSYLFARLPSQAGIVVSLVLLCEVPLIMLWGPTWHLSWWTYHALYALAFVVLLASWAMEARRAGTLRAIADAITMRDALGQLNRGRDSHLLELVDAIEIKDAATLGHVSRVASYALQIGRRLGLGASELRALVLAAQMHDVGKISTPEALLKKPGALTDEEFAEIQKHTLRGHEIALRTPALRELAPVIRAHHERLSGNGYPDGLRGEAIPLLARIIAVADTYDAITSQRPYRGARTHDAAIAELRRVAGAELDARCVAALLDAFAAEQPQAA